MAATQLADIYDAEGFASIIDQKMVEKNAFYQSGVVMEDTTINALASAGGKIGALPHNGPLGSVDPNISSDDPATKSTPQKIPVNLMQYRLAALNQSWSAMDLARDLAAKDPVDNITTRIADYWNTVRNKRIIASGLGVLADNVASNSSDMLYSIATDANTAITDAEKISGEAIVLAGGTSGDRQDEFKCLAIHGALYTRLKLLDLIEYLRDSDGKPTFATYQGKILVVDDALPAVMGSYRITYTSILFGLGAVAHGVGRVANPSELQRIPDAGNGAGQDVIYSRVSEIIHPYGFSFSSGSVAGASPTLAELKLATNWARVWERKNVPFAFLQTNG